MRFLVEALYGLPQNASMYSKDPYQLSVIGLGSTIPSSAALTVYYLVLQYVAS